MILTESIKNERAVRFYLRNDFEIISENTDKDTVEKELMLKWKL